MRKMIVSLALVVLIHGLRAKAEATTWLVKCEPSSQSAQLSLTALKQKGLNIVATLLKEDAFRDDVCGASGLLLGIYLSDSEVDRAKKSDTFLKNAPEGYPPKTRRVH